MDIPELGISGDIRMQSIAPAHGPCGPAVDGETLKLNWDLYWVNAIPDSQASVNLKINGTTLAFQGSGYHDKNWAPFNFIAYLNQWYWGHGRAGSLSVVWFYHLDTANEVVASAYIAQDNKIIHSACSGVTVRPFGEGVEYPLPDNYNATIAGYEINIDAGSLGNYTFTATANRSIVDPAGYDRWIGILEGGLVGGESYSGPALWEQMGPSVVV
ncbi:Tyrosinase family protein asqI [Lasiodiplodia hormozganensis]|uniref:Tyrosinase family protein asqI n=2 Tax=Lasiodiplodia TaxID=66739 RepID=A0AA39XPE0_9PEZI|nr:Tyrosinase family protein asqI [Lasiodiplodia hormozganensis]